MKSVQPFRAERPLSRPAKTLTGPNVQQPKTGSTPQPLPLVSLVTPLVRAPQLLRASGVKENVVGMLASLGILERDKVYGDLEDALPGEYTPEQLIPGEDTHQYDFPEGPAWELLVSKPLAGGTLDIVRWYKQRMLRIWLPPGYDKASAEAAGGLPSVLLHDAQNLFDPLLSMSRTTWQAAETASTLITSGVLPPFVIIGIDHPGLARPYEYTPYTPGTAPGGFRQDAVTWPGGGVEAYLDRLVYEVVPKLSDRYGLSERPAERVMGGSSFGGIATLCAALKYPEVWGCSLIESPSLWIAEEKFLKEDIAEHEGTLPGRVFIGMGGREFSGVRSPEVAQQYPEADATVAGYATTLSNILQEKGLKEGESLLLEVQPDATHNEAAWADRLPRALTHLGTQWWSRLLEHKQHYTYLTVPSRLRPGSPAVMLVNKACTSVAHCKSLLLDAGFNYNWELKQPDIFFKPVPWQATTQHTSENVNGNGNGSQQGASSDWWCCSFEVPEDAYEMHFVLCGTHEMNGHGHREWDNNAGSNFYIRIGPALPPPEALLLTSNSSNNSDASTHVAEENEAQTEDKEASKDGEASSDNGTGSNGEPLAVIQAREALAANPQPLAYRNSSKMYFTVPEKLLAGAPAMIYFNRRRSNGFYSEPNIKLHYGWNGWDAKLLSGGAATIDFKPTKLWRDEWTDWWAVPVDVPEDAREMNFALTNGVAHWDSNGGYNYSIAVSRAKAAGISEVRPRAVERVESFPHGAGTMHIVFLSKRLPTDPGYNKQSRWNDEKIIRVWTPPGWSPDNTPPGGWPVLYMSDGQNLFEDALAHQGVAWNVGYQASDLVSRGELPGFLVVGIDSAGPLRSLNYLPYAPGTGAGGFRGDAERWPGGGVGVYMKRVTEEIIPLVQQRFNASSDPNKTAFGGGSFGGVCALWAAMHYPQMFGGILAESPSLWIAEGRFLGDLAGYRGPLPERIFLGAGTKEYSATRDHERSDVDSLLLHYCHEAARLLDEKGARPGQGRLKFHIEDGAGHHEGAWKWRFSGAMKYLWHHLWDLQPQPRK